MTDIVVKDDDGMMYSDNNLLKAFELRSHEEKKQCAKDWLVFAAKYSLLKSVSCMLDVLDIPYNGMSVKERLCYYYLLKD